MPVNMPGDQHLVPRFFVHSVKNDAKTTLEGRPIYDDMECVELRTPGDKLRVGVYPAIAHSHWTVDEHSKEQRRVTYAERFAQQYKAFKANEVQIQSGTPLDEAPFLTQGKRLELRALGVLTVEQLAHMEGPNLKNLGQGGRELKNQAQAYLDNASGSANATAMAKQIAALQAQIAELTGEKKPVDQFDGMEDEAIKAWIKEKSGAAPRGTPSRETLLRMAREYLAGQPELETVDE